MDLLQLKYFREVARTQQLSRTAEKLHIAQPSSARLSNVWRPNWASPFSTDRESVSV